MNNPIDMSRVPATAFMTDGSFCVGWTEPNCGWGEFHFYIKDGKLHIDNELMSKEFIKKMLCRMVDDATLDCTRDDLESTDGL